ncbi:sulfite exporter TauE/SafE family protein [Capnocytophaga sp. ARDL2]|uniref:sulfite exporter TauE/SafE family protein n=1 Tax=Capnocytophaga sp. ARDL2 TaxID=3238809 RepID=UPI003556C0E9
MIAPLLLGLLSSLHCLGMCGPIALALPIHTFSFTRKTSSIVLYHLGRISVYSLIGLLFGTLGRTLFIAGFQQKLSIILGVVLIFSVVFFNKKMFQLSLFTKTLLFTKIRGNFTKYFQQKTPISFLVIGMLNGLLPCAMVYMALFGALSTQGVWEGAFFMFCFGLGTIPLMTTIVWVGQWVSQSMRQKLLKFVPILLVLMGILLILRGMDLDIPYISPSTLQLFITANPQCY